MTIEELVASLENAGEGQPFVYLVVPDDGSEARFVILDGWFSVDKLKSLLDAPSESG